MEDNCVICRSQTLPDAHVCTDCREALDLMKAIEQKALDARLSHEDMAEALVEIVRRSGVV